MLSVVDAALAAIFFSLLLWLRSSRVLGEGLDGFCCDGCFFVGIDPSSADQIGVHGFLLNCLKIASLTDLSRSHLLLKPRTFSNKLMDVLNRTSLFVSSILDS